MVFVAYFKLYVKTFLMCIITLYNICLNLIDCPVIHKQVLWQAAKHHKGTLLNVDRVYQRTVEKDEPSVLLQTPAIDLYVPSY